MQIAYNYLAAQGECNTHLIQPDASYGLRRVDSRSFGAAIGSRLHTVWRCLLKAGGSSGHICFSREALRARIPLWLKRNENKDEADPDLITLRQVDRYLRQLRKLGLILETDHFTRKSKNAVRRVVGWAPEQNYVHIPEPLYQFWARQHFGTIKVDGVSGKQRRMSAGGSCPGSAPRSSWGSRRGSLVRDSQDPELSNDVEELDEENSSKIARNGVSGINGAIGVTGFNVSFSSSKKKKKETSDPGGPDFSLQRNPETESSFLATSAPNLPPEIRFQDYFASSPLAAQVEQLQPEKCSSESPNAQGSISENKIEDLALNPSADSGNSLPTSIFMNDLFAPPTDPVVLAQQAEAARRDAELEAQAHEIVNETFPPHPLDLPNAKFPAPKWPMVSIHEKASKKASLMINAYTAAVHDETGKSHSFNKIDAKLIGILAKRHDELEEHGISPHAWARVRIAFLCAETETDEGKKKPKKFSAKDADIHLVFPEKIEAWQINKALKEAELFRKATFEPPKFIAWVTEYDSRRQSLLLYVTEELRKGVDKKAIRAFVVQQLAHLDAMGSFPTAPTTLQRMVSLCLMEWRQDQKLREDLIHDGRWGWA